jgi:hypothetical protein
VEDLLADLEVELCYVEQAYHGGAFPPLLKKVVGAYCHALEKVTHVAHEEEAKGWDVVELVHGGARRLLAIAAGKEWKGLRPPWEWGQPECDRQ